MTTNQKTATSDALSVEDFARVFEPFGHTDVAYLKHHYQRYASTLTEFQSTWAPGRGMRVLDIGAHWLHQSVLWRNAGFEVSALDLPATFDMSSVQSIAGAMDITLIRCTDLDAADAFDIVADSSIDVIVFAEIIEHLTFNPVRLWKQIHRVLALSGRIVITTPNYYAWNGRAWDIGRFIKGFGGGITVDEILNTHTYGHHWREFTRHELIRYFCLLSPDFNTTKAKTVRNYYPPLSQRSKRVKGRIFENFPGLRPNLHLEIELTSKKHGIVASPAW